MLKIRLQKRTHRGLIFACMVVLVAVASLAALSIIASPAKGAATNPGMARIPKSMRGQYAGIPSYETIGPNPYANWHPAAPPWQICYNDSYQGNTWRTSALSEAQKLNKQLVKGGLSKGNMIVTNSNNDVNTQVAQLNNQVVQGCQIIFTQPASAVGLCSAITNAFKHHVLVISVVAPAACKDIVNTDLNEFKAGYDTGHWIAKAIGGKGNVLIIDGIPGVASNDARTAGAKAGLTAYPGIKIIGQVAGRWTPSIVKTQVLKFLATHSQVINGVWQSAFSIPAVGDAFKEFGRPMPKINGFCGDCGELAYWHDNKLEAFGYNQGGAPAIYEPFYIALRMMYGAKPVTNLLIYPLPKITNANLDKWWKPSMTVNSTCWSNPPDGRYVPDSYWTPLFKGGEKPPVTLKP